MQLSAAHVTSSLAMEARPQKLELRNISKHIWSKPNTAECGTCHFLAAARQFLRQHCCLFGVDLCAVIALAVVSSSLAFAIRADQIGHGACEETGRGRTPEIDLTFVSARKRPTRCICDACRTQLHSVRTKCVSTCFVISVSCRKNCRAAR